MHKLTAGIGSLALVAGSAFFVATVPGSAASAADSLAVSAVQSQRMQGEWVWSFTEWQSDPNPPVHQYGSDVTWGERQERSVEDQPARTETIEHPAVTEEVHHPATEDSAGLRWQWHPNPHVDEGGSPPSFPTDPNGWWTSSNAKWNGTEPLGVPFQEGGGNQGNNASWFYWERIPGQPEWTETVVVEEAWTETIEHPGTSTTEYRWAVGTWVEADGGGNATDGGTDQGVEAETESDTDQTEPAAPTPGQTQPSEADAPEADVPTVIDAGL
jgi:hypothetical protein